MSVQGRWGHSWQIKIEPPTDNEVKTMNVILREHVENFWKIGEYHC